MALQLNYRQLKTQSYWVRWLLIKFNVSGPILAIEIKIRVAMHWQYSSYFELTQHNGKPLQLKILQKTTACGKV